MPANIKRKESLPKWSPPLGISTYSRSLLNIVEISDCGFIREATAWNINFDVSPSLTTQVARLATAPRLSSSSSVPSPAPPRPTTHPSQQASSDVLVKVGILLFGQNEVESGEICGIAIGDISRRFSDY
jgi:hypothetical protein